MSGRDGGLVGNRLAGRLAALKAEGRKALIPYLTAGDPWAEATVRFVRILAEAGADCVELGLPFSDPLADGPTIQAAVQRSLAGGFRVADLWRIGLEVRASCQVPLAVMTYFNPVLQYGIRRFTDDAAAAGFDALLVPDLPPEEAGELREACRRVGLCLVPFAAPTSTPDRLALVARHACGFVYCVTVTGVTGERQEPSARLAELVARLRPLTDTPLAAGFGIAGPEQARAAAAVADAVIVGSALVRLVAEYGRDVEGAAAALADRTRALREALDRC
ncbi:MAG: tryptophan synthase subunit alpha [Clostridia bacterium]|nr:tryptophan synthase subunit alpha [Clostridia bacterium]